MIRSLRQQGISNFVLLSGDSALVVGAVAKEARLLSLFSRCSPISCYSPSLLSVPLAGSLSCALSISFAHALSSPDFLQVGITEWHADCLPKDKATHVERLRRAGGAVMFVGDGVNDALAIAKADVGVALSVHTESETAGTAANIASER